MRERWKMNAMRSGLVVVGAIAFGYLTLQLGFRPYLERAQRTIELESQNQKLENDHDIDQFQQEQPFDFSDSSTSTTN